MKIESLLKWSQPKEVQTRAGARLLRKAEPDQNFWALWKQKNSECRAAGLSVGKDQRTGQWEVCWWQPLSQEDVARKEADKNRPAQLTEEQRDRLEKISPKLLPYQVASVARMVDALANFNGALDASDTGTGKTYVSLAASYVLGRPVYVVCPLSVMASWKKAAAHFGIELAGICNYELLRRGKQPAVKSIESGKTTKFEWMVPNETIIVADECFVRGTKIQMEDGATKNIEDVVVGDRVKNAIGAGTVRHTMKRTAVRLVKVLTENGDFVCTPDHPFLTQSGWISACNLRRTHYIKNHETTMRVVQDHIRDKIQRKGHKQILPMEVLLCVQENNSNQELRMVSSKILLPITRGKREQETFLRTLLFSEMENETALGCGHDEKPESSKETEPVNQKGSRKQSITCKKCVNANEDKKSDVQSGVEGEGNGYAKENWTQAADPSRKRNRTNKCGKCVVKSLPQISKQLCCLHDGKARRRFSKSLQSGRGISKYQTCCRMRRIISPIISEARTRSEKRKEVEGIRVVGVEIVQQGDFDQYKEGDQKAVVHNIEVSGHPSYVLENGAVVHNCHRAKDGKTLNSAMLTAAINQGYTVIGVSATAADNPMQMKFCGLLTKLFSHEKQFFGWMLRNGVQRGRFGLEFVGGQRALHKIHHEIFPLHGTRLKIADLGDAFPETQIAAEAYNVNGAADEINRIHEEMEKEIQAILESESEDKGNCILTVMLRARQKAEVLKIPAVVDMIEDAVEDGMSVAVFVNFDSSADALMERLKTKCCIRGGQKVSDRDQCIAAFQADKEHVIVCNIRAGGVGVSLHGTPTSRRRMSIIMPSFSGQDMKQALGRVWRANGAKSIQRIFFAADTIEENVCAKVNAKIARIDTLNDGDLTIGSEPVVENSTAPAIEINTDGVQPQAVKPVRTQKEVDREQQNERIAALKTPELASQAKTCLQFLAARCDGARQIDGAGFAKYDVEYGKRLAYSNSESWGKREFAAAVRMVNRYRGQLEEDAAPFVEIMQSIK